MGAAWISLSLSERGEQYFDALIATAKRLRDQGDNEMAVVAAQMACEVYIEIVMTAMFEARKIDHLAEPVEDLMPSYSLGNAKVRKLYEALCDDHISQRPFWSNFKEHTSRRNKIVHGGKRVNQAQAEASIKAVEGVIQHIQGWFGKT